METKLRQINADIRRLTKQKFNKSDIHKFRLDVLRVQRDEMLASLKG